MAKFLSNINLEAANDIQFKTTAGANAGKISQTGDDLVISNAVGDILLGNGSDDVFIGDGTNTVDIRFEQDMAIFADSSSTRTLTLGGTNTNLVLESPSISGTMTLGATTINNKLTFTGGTGYILFDYEPTTSSGEYTNEVPLLKVDRSGTELSILSRMTNNGGLVLGIDDTTAVIAGDVKANVKSGWNYAAENVILAAEGGFYAWGWPNNMSDGSSTNNGIDFSTYASRYEFRFRTDAYDNSSSNNSTINNYSLANNGLYLGAGGGTQFIDMSRNLKNIGTISSGAITSTGAIEGSSIVKTGGSSSEFLKADGSVDSNTYITSQATDFVSKASGGTFSGDIAGNNNMLSSFFLPQNPEGSHVKAPWFFNDMAYSRLRGATITVTVNGGSAPGNTDIDKMFDAATGFWNMPTSGVTSVVIEMTNPPKTMYHGAHYGVTFGNSHWRAKNVDIDAYYSSAYQEVVSITGNTKEFIYGTKNSGNNAVEKIKWTFSDFNTTSMRIVSLFAYNYNSTGMPGLYLSKDGGEMYGNLSVGSNSLTAGSLDINGDADISGTITTATWNGAVISSAYLDSDTAHLSGSQTFTGAKTMEGNLTLDDGAGDTPTLRFINGDDDVYQFFNDSSSDMKLTRTNNGGVDYNFNAHETDYTQSVLQIGGTSTFGTDVTIAGNLTVNGTTVTVDTTNLNVQDKNITLNYSTSDSSSSANGAGITIQDAVNSSTDATILWDTSANTFKISHPINVLGNILTSGTVDGRDLQTDGTKLDTIDTNANAYVHPTNAGNKHIPAGGATDQFLQYAGSAGTAQWVTLSSSDVGLGNVANVDQRNASNINNGTLGASFLPTTISSNTQGSAASLSGLSLGDIVYGGESGYAKLSGNAESSNKFLRSRGAANTATEPEWTQVGYADLTGTVPTWNQNTTGSAATLSSTLAVNRGGTGAASLDAAGIVEKTGSQTISGTKTFTGSILLDDGTGSSPTMRFMNEDNDEVSIFCNPSGKMKFQQKLDGASNVVQMTMDENGLDVVNGLKINGSAVHATDTSTSLGTSNTLVPSQNAVKSYVDNEVASAGGGTMSNFLLAATGTTGTATIAQGNTVTFGAGTGITATRSGNQINITNSAPNVVQTTITGNAGTATKLQTARNIAGTSFDGSANIDISYANLTNKPTIPTNNNQLTNGAGYTTNTGTTTASNTQTFTNKTIDANGTGNSITNIDIGNMTAAVIVTESEGIGNNDNDTTIPTSAAVVDYVANNAGGGSGLPTAPNSDKILIYDYSAGVAKWATPNNNLAILGTNINATDTNTWQANTDTQAGYVAAGGQSNKVWKTNGAGVPGWRTDANTNTTYTAGSLLDLSSTTFNVDLTEAAAATIAAGDNIIFLDGGATGTQSKGSIDDVATLFAGTGLSASNGVLSVNIGHGLSFDVDTIKPVSNNNITIDNNGISVSDDIFNTNLRIGRGGTGMYMDYKTESDAITIRTDHATSASSSDGNRKFEFTNGGIFRSLGTQVLNYTGWSDKRLKENIKNLNYGLDAIMKLRPVSYDWKKEVDADKTNSLGFIAQEVEKVIPELVTESKTIFDDKKAKGVDYVKMVAVLTKAVQEQQKQIDELKKLINGNSSR